MRLPAAGQEGRCCMKCVSDDNNVWYSVLKDDLTVPSARSYPVIVASDICATFVTINGTHAQWKQEEANI